MRYIRYASIAIFGLALVLIALANRNMVTLRVLPDELAGFAALNPTYELPLFVVIFGGIALGLIVGFIWEWIREAGERLKRDWIPHGWFSVATFQEPGWRIA